jgi:8-oxo-dGTP diphosphatase
MKANTLNSFPKAYWAAWDSDIEFIPGSELPEESEGRMFAVIVHAFFGSQVLTADIMGRGVCVPSGRINPGESVDAAAVRETLEETGAHLDPNCRQLIGCYKMTRRKKAAEVVYSACFVAEVTNFEAIPVGSESAGYFLLAPEDVEDHYFMWDDLLAAAFKFAWAERVRLFPPGQTVERALSTNC